MKLYSNIEPAILLHVVNRFKDISDGRKDITDEEQYLQVATIKCNKEKYFKAHRHIPLYREVHITQESFVIIQGKVEVKFYDLDDTFLYSTVLCVGDCCVTFLGGHSYKFLGNNTICYEYKQGPYMGQKLDKVWIDE